LNALVHFNGEQSFMDREARIDIVRGLAMVTIAINHMGFLLGGVGYRGVNIPTLTAFGFSSSAEIFFLLSGYMVGMVYLNKANLRTKVFSRAARIYVYNLFGFISVLVLAGALPAPVVEATNLDYTLAHPSTAGLMFLAFLQHPYLLGVLQLYVLFMLLTPAAAALATRQEYVLIAISAMLFLATKWFPQFNLPGGAPEGDWLWNFNPFAWQFLFFMGMLLGRRRCHESFFRWLDHSIKRPVLVFIVFGIFAIVFRLQMGGSLSPVLVSRTNLGFLNLLHSFVGVTTMAALATLLLRYAKWPANKLAAIGKNTLECYVASIPLTYAMAALWLQLPHHLAAYFLANVLVVAGILCVAEIKIRLAHRTQTLALGK
jgi:hypothetical protein